MTHHFHPLFAAAALACALPMAGMAQEMPSPLRTISVIGAGEVEIKPDLATLSIGVRHEAATAGEAMELMAEAMGPVLARLTAAGINDADVQTGRLGLDPVYEHRNNEPPLLRGFAANTSVNVTVRDIDGLGEVLDAVVSDGANTLGGISFGVSDPAEALNEARIAAVADARARAEVYASAAGVTLGEILSLSESGASSPRPMVGAQMEMARAVPIMAGEVSVSAQISVTYAIE